MADLKPNSFKAALRRMEVQHGIWCALRDPLAAEMLATCGYDWMLFDCEHAPNDVASVLSLLQAVAPHPVSPLVRPSHLNAAEIKRLLDIGAQTLLIPYVQTAEEAAEAVAAVTYPPAGIRGVAGLTRATGYGQVAGYHATARDEICLLVQVETEAALARIDAIAAVPGIDGIFVGPADLAASMGLPGQPGAPEVKSAVLSAIKRIRGAGQPPGVLTLDPVFARECIDAGAVFVSCDLDMAAMRKGLTRT
ncbi:HpcH/HpaI aldolase family protein [Pseudoponticoccus marisrubri]|uniref:Hydroxypyruvate/pyruvate aldolase n=1 Tax=Pseudoponticoccus marisrubri TaxID=1685382 RepID=A0A0W7WJ87_9RHOB|nr:aldolase/citrate lyase family protein [Pseudoponticoccus marisrubri]KUF10580.1 4-hydroxy-2-oxo-heptane-1,7-dioate aldolase [Pseudoponticoccus marisrubri]